MTKTSFQAWRKHLNLTVTQAAMALGVSTRTINYWESGKTPIPLMAALACGALAYNLKPWK